MPLRTPSKPNLVVFCGAGFSKLVGIPTMDSFPEHLRDSGFLSSEEQADLDHVQQVCSSLASTIGASARNLEQLASFLSILQLANPDFKFEGCRHGISTPKQAQALLTQCIAFLVRPDLEARYTNKARELVSLGRHTNLTFVTTNYDIHIELAAFLAGRPCNPPEDMVCVPAGTVPSTRRLYADSSASDTTSLFKLHGSVNWSRKGQEVEYLGMLDATQRTTQDQKVRVLDCWLKDLRPSDQKEGKGVIRDVAAQWCKQHQPLIIPPTVIKPNMLDTLPALRHQWSGASRAIESADQLWFIGYSFPETDSFMRFFLGASLFRNTRLRQIVVIDPSIDRIESRARPLFASPHHQEVFLGLPVGWEYVELEALRTKDLANAIPQNVLNMIRHEIDRGLLLSGHASSFAPPAPTTQPHLGIVPSRLVR